MNRRPGEARAAPDGGADRFPSPHAGRWCADERDDPITGLVAWPGFHRQLPALLSAALRAGVPVGFAIGDVDDLKDHVEGVRDADPESFGHLAGNALMRRLGEVAREWWSRTGVVEGCLATFGGDEIVLAAEVPDAERFRDLVTELRDRLAAALPRPVSFAATTVRPAQLPGDVVGDEWICGFCTHVIGEVDRALVGRKHDRRESGDVPLGFVVHVPPLSPE
ncbi:MAG TPA: GGDEF domain-containing protein [Mycobacteriales bacterium]|jgi:GGDEF domain-containing protein